MKTNFFYAFLIFVFTLLVVPFANASHLAGGQITYRWLGGNQYHIVFSMYRDCAGIPAPTTVPISLISTCGGNLIATATPLPGTGTEVTMSCPGYLTTCQGGSQPGLQKWEYAVDYTLPHTCSDWTFSISENARNGAITTLVNASGSNMYVEAHLNDTLFNHDSPVFSGEPNLYYCIGIESPIDNSALDMCDSLGYSLICPRSAPNVCMGYTVPFSPTNFVSSFPAITLDSITGKITITPTTQEVGVYAILVKQYHNGVFIGSIMRDVQLYIRPCAVPNHFPVLSGINNSTFQYNTVFPFNKATCFNIYSADSDSGQTTKIFLIDSIVGSNFVIDTTTVYQSAQFCWTPAVTDTGCAHCITVKVNDDNCPNKAGRTLKYCITVVDSAYTPKTIKGTCFLDLNNNGVQDAGEPGFNNLMVNSSGSSLSFSSQPSLQGEFLNYADTGATITTLQNMRPYFSYTPLQHSSYFTTAAGMDTVNFAIVPIPGIQDLQIAVYPLSNSLPGFDVTYRLVYANVGTDTVSGTVSLIKDSRLSVIASTPIYTSISGDSIIWNYITLLPGESRVIDVVLNLPSYVTIGNTLISSAIVDPIATDSTPVDNVSSLQQIVRGAYDPNDKSMTGGAVVTPIQIASGEYFTYLIRFQNTGTYPAFRVIVLDTLDTKLDASTFEMISSSHNYSVNMKDNKYLSWTFNNILLPDSGNNEPASHGYIAYRIKPKSTVAGGDIIYNTAGIIFDYNLPVITNTAITTIELFTAVANVGTLASNIHMFPNPTDGACTISYMLQKSSSVKIEVFNSFGQSIEEISNGRQSAGNHEILFNDIKLVAGIYFVKMTVNGNSALIKMVKIIK